MYPHLIHSSRPLSMEFVHAVTQAQMLGKMLKVTQFESSGQLCEPASKKHSEKPMLSPTLQTTKMRLCNMLECP